MSRIATGSGDEGKTSLFGGQRVSKRHRAVEAYGSIDETNAALGLVHNAGDADVRRWVERVQAELFVLGAELATPGGGDIRIGAEHVARLDTELDALEEKLPPLKTFVLPAGNEVAARMHFARTVCRRAERRVVELHESDDGPVRSEVRVYLNRLGDLLFLKAREAAVAVGREVKMDFGPFRKE